MKAIVFATILAIEGATVAASDIIKDTLLFPWENRRLENAQTSQKYASLFAFDTTGPILSSGQCKPGPGSPNWPTLEVWDAFNHESNGALIRTVPVAAPCYNSWGVFDADKCENITNSWNDPLLHVNDPTSIMWPMWEGRTCLPTSNLSSSECTLGAYPVYAVNATSVAHVQLAVNFARNQGLRLVVKNTGHDYQGRSSGAGALSIWTQSLQDLDYIQNYTIGDFEGEVLHIAAGLQAVHVSSLADQHHSSLVAGMCGSVGYAGGYFAGGGHSPLSGLFGAGADHVLAVNVVTPDGRFVTASEQENTDLFWALRGGGGSTFGVTTSVVTRVLPHVEVTNMWFSFQTSANVSNETFWQGARVFLNNLDRMEEAGLYFFTNIRSNSPYYDNSSYSLALEPMMAPNKSISELHTYMEPVYAGLRELGIPYQINATHYPSFHKAWDAAWPASGEYVADPNTVDGSWIFPRKAFRTPEAFNATYQSIKGVVEDGLDITGFGVSPRNPYNAKNAVNPALRENLFFVSTSIILSDDPSPDELRSASNRMINDVIGSWKAAAPMDQDGGTYANEANANDPDWKRAFYGVNYDRLLQIKRRYDPNELFYTPAGVGSEEWEVRTQAQGIQTQNGPLCRKS